jgi:hypothetical protein
MSQVSYIQHYFPNNRIYLFTKRLSQVLYNIGSSWSWSYGSWIYDYLCNQCLSPLSCEFEPCSWRGVLDTTLSDKVCQWLTTGWQFSPGTPVSCTNKSDRHDIIEILLKVALNTINQQTILYNIYINVFTQWHTSVQDNSLVSEQTFLCQLQT